MKYINIDILIAEIERWRDKAKEKYNESTYSMGRCDALAEFRNHIVSLLQKQPECIYGRTPEEREKCCKFCSAICEARIEQEQPEVDLEKEIEMYISSKGLLDYAFLIPSIARHFYELGLNARQCVKLCHSENGQ